MDGGRPTLSEPLTVTESVYNRVRGGTEARGELKGREPNVIDGRIDGETLLFATPGDPIAQVRLPLVMGPVFAALGINAVWVPMHADRKGLHIVLEAIRTIRNFRGITVAIPHKMAVLDMVEDVSDVARAAGAVNLVRREPDGTLFGDMADGAGFCAWARLPGSFGARGLGVADRCGRRRCRHRRSPCRSWGRTYRHHGDGSRSRRARD